MKNYSNSPLSHLALNICSSIFETIAFVISIILLCFIICRCSFNNYAQNRNQWKHNIPIILSVNALILHVAKGFIQFMSVNLKTVKRDFYWIPAQKDSFFCRFCSYMFFSVISALYWSYVIQAMFRFTRVLCPKCSKLHRTTTYVYLFIPLQILLSFLSASPLLFVFNSIRLIPDETYCTISMEEFTPLIYFFLVIFCLPMSIIFTLYICLICLIRLSFLPRRSQTRNQRDYMVVRRILFIVVIVGVTSIPAVIDLIVFVPNGHLDLFIYRLQWTSSSVNSLVFVLTLPFVNPQLFEILKKPKEYKKYVTRSSTTKQTVPGEL